MDVLPNLTSISLPCSVVSHLLIKPLSMALDEQYQCANYAILRLFYTVPGLVVIDNDPGRNPRNAKFFAYKTQALYYVYSDIVFPMAVIGIHSSSQEGKYERGLS